MWNNWEPIRELPLWRVYVISGDNVDLDECPRGWIPRTIVYLESARGFRVVCQPRKVRTIVYGDKQ